MLTVWKKKYYHSMLAEWVSEKILPEVTAWQNRSLEAIYPFVFMDAIHYKVKENHQYVAKAAYVVLGINLDGQKDILGIWIGENESSKFWLNVLNELKTRGIKDVFLFCVDSLKDYYLHKILRGAPFHSEQGIQHTSNQYFNLINSYDITQSMSGYGNLYDNSLA